MCFTGPDHELRGPDHVRPDDQLRGPGDDVCADDVRCPDDLRLDVRCPDELRCPDDLRGSDELRCPDDVRGPADDERSDLVRRLRSSPGVHHRCDLRRAGTGGHRFAGSGIDALVPRSKF